MAKPTGKNMTIDFGGVEYACLTDLSMDGSVSVASAECSTTGTGNAVTHKAVGAETWTASTTILVDSQSITQQQAFAPGVSGVLIYYPNGNTEGNAMYTWANAFVATDSESVAVASQSTLAVGFECDGSRVPSLVPAP